MDRDRPPPDGPAVSAVILAGGQSRRLGQDKAFLPVGGQPLVVRAVQALAAVSDDLIVVTSDPAPYDRLGLPIRLVGDERPGEGSLMGIYSGLKAAYCPYALVVACDMPFLSVPLLSYLVRLVEGYDVVIPVLGHMAEPLHAVYGKACLPAMARLLDRGERQIIAFFPDVRVRYVGEDEVNPIDPLHLSFVNVNTPEDWDRVRRLSQ